MCSCCSEVQLLWYNYVARTSLTFPSSNILNFIKLVVAGNNKKKKKFNLRTYNYISLKDLGLILE